MLYFVALLSVRVDSRSIQERLGVLAAPREVRSTFFFARLRSAVPQLLLCPTETELLRLLFFGGSDSAPETAQDSSSDSSPVPETAQEPSSGSSQSAPETSQDSSSNGSQSSTFLI